MTTVVLTKDNFDRTVADNDMVVVDFLGALVRAVPLVRTRIRSGIRAPRRHRVARSTPTEEQELAGHVRHPFDPNVDDHGEKVILYHEAGSLPGKGWTRSSARPRRSTCQRCTRKSPGSVPLRTARRPAGDSGSQS